MTRILTKSAEDICVLVHFKTARELQAVHKDALLQAVGKHVDDGWKFARKVQKRVFESLERLPSKKYKVIVCPGDQLMLASLLEQGKPYKHPQNAAQLEH